MEFEKLVYGLIFGLIVFAIAYSFLGNWFIFLLIIVGIAYVFLNYRDKIFQKKESE